MNNGTNGDRRPDNKNQNPRRSNNQNRQNINSNNRNNQGRPRTPQNNGYNSQNEYYEHQRRLQAQKIQRQRELEERTEMQRQEARRLSEQRARQRAINKKNASRIKALEAERRRLRRQQFRANFKNMAERAAAVLVFSLIGLVIALGALVFFIQSDFSKAPKNSTFPVGIKLEENKPTILSDDEYSYRNGEYYVCLSALSEKMGFSILGDVKKMTLSISDTQKATFDVGSTAVSINGTGVSLTNPTYFSKGKLFVPCSFFTRYCENTSDEVTKDGGARHYELKFPKDISFSCAATTPTTLVTGGTNVNDASPDNAEKPMFTLDLSEYEQYMNPENPDEYLTLINVSNPLSSDYIPDDLTDVVYTRSDRAKQKMRLYAEKSLEAMFKEMYAAGYSDVTVTSGYRSYDYQTQLFNNEIASLKGKYGDKAEQKAAEAVAIPGTSEHQSGLCADLHNLSAASVSFANEDAYKWLFTHCGDFGFILRFPKDKTDITKIMFEPWHYRFVGRYHAQKIMSSGLCLEEYVEQLKSQN